MARNRVSWATVIPGAVALKGADLALAIKGVLWHRVVDMPDEHCPNWGPDHDTLFRSLDCDAWGKDVITVWLYDGLLWRARETDRSIDRHWELEDDEEEMREYVAEYALPNPSFVYHRRLAELEANGQITIQFERI